ncbi:MAG: hypothetical protein LBF71_05990, partial [Campylobacteraceae bacterium]|nr:hypothetical protein [Campylobacteraceae bacterium]
MATAEESLGTLHENYSDYTLSGATTGTRVPSNFEECLLWTLEHSENEYYNARRLHDADGLTIGYGFDLENAEGTTAQKIGLLVYGLTSGATTDRNSTLITNEQRTGLTLIENFINGNGTLDRDDIVSMARGQRPAGTTQAQVDAIASIQFTQAQAETVLRALLYGNEGGIREQNSYIYLTRNLLSRRGDIDNFPESTELVALVVMRFRGDLYGNVIQETIDNDKNSYVHRAAFWFSIIQRLQVQTSNNLIDRLNRNSQMFGILPSDVTEADHENVLKAASLLYREHLETALGFET